MKDSLEPSDFLSRKRLEYFENSSLDLILAPWGFGGTDNLAQEGALSLIESDLVQKLKAIKQKVNLIETHSLGPFQTTEEENRIRNVEAISHINEWLRETIEDSLAKGSIPVTIGGDASLSIASISALANHSKDQDFGVLVLSNHLGDSSPEVTRSWNANRMVFSILSENSKKPHPDLQLLRGAQKAVISKEQIVHVGISHKSAKGEADHSYFTMEDIEEVGAKEITRYIINDLFKDFKKVHLVWDANSLNLSAVSNYAPGQLTYREAIGIAREIDLGLRRTGKLQSIDIVEYCPSKEAWDKRGEAAEGICDIIANIFGETIFNCLRKY